MTTSSPVKPMLAVKTDDLEGLTYPLLASWKLDGIRCIMTEAGPQTRSGEVIPNRYVRECLETLPAGPDGELVCLDERGVPDFRLTTGNLRRAKGEPRFVYYVFDNWLHPGPFWMRLRSVEGWKDKPQFVRPLAHVPAHSAGHVRELFAAALEAGQEGLVLRDMMGAYKHGRSTVREGGMVKVKPYEDDEAVVLGWTEMRRNENVAEVSALGRTKRSSAKAGRREAGVLGALTVSSPKWPRTFEIGSGFDASDRASLWANRDKLIGKVVKFRYVAVGGYDVPRHGVFLGWREAWDMEDPLT